jgi:hypothetical protein
VQHLERGGSRSRLGDEEASRQARTRLNPVAIIKTSGVEYHSITGCWCGGPASPTGRSTRCGCRWTRWSGSPTSPSLPDRTIYATSPGPGPKTLRLAALTPSRQVRWTAATTDEIFNAQLRIGPYNTVLVYAGVRWTPLTTPAGRPLALAEQRRPEQSATAPTRRPAVGRHPRVMGGEWRFALTNQAGRTLGGWRVTRQTRTKFLYEDEVLRLARTGGTSTRFAIASESRVVYGDSDMTGLRIGPDGQLYQLRSSRTAGVSIARYSLTPARQDPRTRSPWPADPPPTIHERRTGSAARLLPVVAVPAWRRWWSQGVSTSMVTGTLLVMTS